jgi:hypothetical protein
MVHAVVVREMVAADRIEDSKASLENVVPQARKAPGIVGAYFTITHEGHTWNLFVFESEEAATAALARIKDAPRPPFVQLESVEVVEVLASF